jgi:hypothetical protein
LPGIPPIKAGEGVFSSWNGADNAKHAYINNEYGWLGTIAADGSIITGRFACLELLPFELSFVATKCGNGILDEREDCESGVCCSDGCKFDVGAFCNEDACSAGLCDASGSCFGNVPFAAGTHCEVDGDNCTDDWCDGEGACVAVATTVCDGCSACNETHECEPVARYLNNSGPGGCRTFPGTQFNDTSLLISNREGRERVKWSLRGGYIEEASQFGDPAADTGYQLCVFYRDLTTDPWRVAAMARAEPGVGWHRRPFGLRFADREATGGLSSVKLHASSTPRKSQVAAAGRGDGLIVTPDLDDVLVAAEGGFVQAELRADNGKCWGWVYSSRRFGSELKSSDGLLRVRRGR